MSNKRTMTRLAGLLVVGTFVFAACSGSGSSSAPSVAAGDMDALIAAAKAEGGLTTIALPHSWCNYGEVLSTASPPSTASRSTS